MGMLKTKPSYKDVKPNQKCTFCFKGGGGKGTSGEQLAKSNFSTIISYGHLLHLNGTPESLHPFKWNACWVLWARMAVNQVCYLKWITQCHAKTRGLKRHKLADAASSKYCFNVRRVKKQKSRVKYSELCGTFQPPKRGHRKSHLCLEAHYYVCMSVSPNLGRRVLWKFSELNLLQCLNL